MNYRNIYRVLATKDALNVLMDISEGCKVEQPVTFADLHKMYKLSKPSLRRITNRLSRCGLIRSSKDTTSSDGRKRVYIVRNMSLCDKLIKLTQEILYG